MNNEKNNALLKTDEGLHSKETCDAAMIGQLRNQLEKANQSVAELQQAMATLEKELLRQCAFMKKTAEKLEQHREWQATASVLRRPTREAEQALNEFAIEKKIEALDAVEATYIEAAETSEPMSFREAFDLVEEQLRKGQEL